MLTALDRFLGATEKLFFVAANVALIVMLVINTANIGSRFLFERGIIWVFPWTTVLFVWMVFLGFYVLYRRKRDIAVDILYNALPASLQNAVSIFTNLVVIALMATIIWQAPILLPRQVGKMDYVGLQRYWLAIPFYASCGLILLDFLHDTAERLLRGPAAAAEPEANAYTQGGPE